MFDQQKCIASVRSPCALQAMSIFISPDPGRGFAGCCLHVANFRQRLQDPKASESCDPLLATLKLLDFFSTANSGDGSFRQRAKASEAA